MASAWSSTHSVATSICGSWRIFVSIGSSAATVLPSAGITFSWGSNDVKKVATRSWKPLNTESVTTSAIVATATPITEMALITLMACVDFFENRYLRAMKNGKFIILVYSLQFTVYS